MPTDDLRRIFSMPLLLAVLSLIGLMSALLGDGWWDRLSWAALGLPLLIVVWRLCRPPLAVRR